jgi:hypothetical protein
MDLDPTACLFVGQELKGEKTGNYKEQDPPPTRQWGSIRRKGSAGTPPSPWSGGHFGRRGMIYFHQQSFLDADSF